MVITHDSELIENIDSTLWILEDNKITFYDNTFDDYHNSIMNESVLE